MLPEHIDDDESTFGSGNDLVTLGTKPLPDPKLAQIYVVIWRH